jgi:hypothetical protein
MREPTCVSFGCGVLLGCYYDEWKASASTYGCGLSSRRHPVNRRFPAPSKFRSTIDAFQRRAPTPLAHGYRIRQNHSLINSNSLYDCTLGLHMLGSIKYPVSIDLGRNDGRSFCNESASQQAPWSQVLWKMTWFVHWCYRSIGIDGIILSSLKKDYFVWEVVSKYNMPGAPDL